MVSPKHFCGGMAVNTGLIIRSNNIPCSSRLSGDERLDKVSILLADLNVVLFNQIIKHHLGGVFVLPFLVLAVSRSNVMKINVKEKLTEL